VNFSLNTFDDVLCHLELEAESLDSVEPKSSTYLTK
jgi:hypothetical protein